MGTVRAFNGTRYNPEVVGDLSRVVAPPYDVISEEERERLASLSQYNVVRLTLPEAQAGMDRFQASADLIDRWRSEGVLVREDAACIYVYRHEFEIEGRSLVRTGLMAVLDLEAGGVSGHEKTVSVAKEDRTRLLATTRSSLGPIFMLYADPHLDVRGVVEDAPAEQIADLEVGGERHLLTAIRDPAVHARLSELLAPRRFTIADGHHRYHAALLNYHSARESGSAEEWNRFTMVFCVAMEDPGLVILAAHRVLTELHGCTEEYVSALGEWAEVEPAEGLEKTLAGMKKSGKGTFGLCAGPPPSFYLVRAAARPASEEALDVEILHTILDSLFKSGCAADLAYTCSARDGVQQVTAGTASMCFFLQPVCAAELMRFSEIGRLMPSKTTYFYPKPLTGLIMQSPPRK